MGHRRDMAGTNTVCLRTCVQMRLHVCVITKSTCTFLHACKTLHLRHKQWQVHWNCCRNAAECKNSCRPIITCKTPRCPKDEGGASAGCLAPARQADTLRGCRYWFGAPLESEKAGVDVRGDAGGSRDPQRCFVMFHCSRMEEKIWRNWT